VDKVFDLAVVGYGSAAELAGEPVRKLNNAIRRLAALPVRLRAGGQ